MKGAKTSMHVSFAKAPGGDGPAQIPMRGPGIVPRRVYLMQGDFSKQGCTQGCPGCMYAHPKRNQSEDCRKRMEEDLSKDASDTRPEKAKERQDHYIAQQILQED